MLVVVAGFVPANEAVTPEGKPDADSVTLLANPLVGLIVIVLVPPAPPCVIVTLDGAADKVKFGVTDAFTVKETLVVCVKLPDTPVMVITEGPTDAESLAVNVRTLVAVVGFVPNAAVTPVGKPVAESVTSELKPLVALTVIVLVPPAPPCVTVTRLGAADKVKLGVVAAGQAFARFVTFTVPMPVAKSQPVAVPYASK